MSTNIEVLERELNAMTGQGKILEALQQFYADDCKFQEGNGASRNGKHAQHSYLADFFKTLKAFNGATLHGSAVSPNYSASEWTFDMTGGDGKRMVWNEILVRRWCDGQVVSEKFYQAN